MKSVFKRADCIHASIIVIMALLCVSCQPSNEKTDKRLSDLETRIADLEHKLNDIKNVAKPSEDVFVKSVGNQSVKGNAEESVSVTPSNLVDPSEAVQENIKLLLPLEQWDYHVTKGELNSDYYSITYTIKNNFAKGIKLIDGAIIFQDLSGNRLFTIQITPDVSIEPGKNIKDGGKYSINPYINEENRMRKMEKNDIKCDIRIKRLVFFDNSSLTF